MATESTRGNRPKSLRLTSTISTALPQTLTRFYYERPRRSKGSSSKGSCRSSGGAPWLRVFARASSSPCTHADKKLGRVLVNLSGPKVLESLGRKRYTLVVLDDFSRYTWVYFVRHKLEATELFEQLFAYTRADGVDRGVSSRNPQRPTVPNSTG